MAYTRKPKYHFDSLTSVGVDKVPLKREVFLKEKNSTLVKVKGDPAFPLTPTSTIDFAIEHEHLAPIGLYNKDWPTSSNEAWYDISEYAFQDLSNVPKDDPEFMPNPYNIPHSRTGDPGFLPIPAYIDYEGSAFPYGVRDVLQAGSDGWLYTYQVRTNSIKRRVYISKIDPLMKSKPIYTSLEYRPPFVGPNEYIDWIYDSDWHDGGGMLVSIRNTTNSSVKYSWIKFYGSADPAAHVHVDVTPIATGTYMSLIYLHKRNQFLKAEMISTTAGGKPDGFTRYTLYDSSFKALSHADGYHWGVEAGHFKYPSNITLDQPSNYHTGYTQLNSYTDDQGVIHFKNFNGFWMPFGTDSRSFDQIEEFIITGNTVKRVTPPGGIPSGGWSILGSGPVIRQYNKTSPRWFRTKPAVLFGNLYLMSHAATTATHGVMYMNENVDEKTAFEHDYGIVPDVNGDYRGWDTDMVIAPPDNSFAGKSIYRLTFARLSEGNSRVDFVLADSAYNPPDDPNDPWAPEVVNTSAMIKGPTANNFKFSANVPTRIDQLQEYPYYAYLSDSTKMNTLYGTKTDPNNADNWLVGHYTKAESLRKGTPDGTRSIPKNKDKYQQLMIDFAVSKGIPEKDIISYYYHLYPIHTSNFGILIVGANSARDSIGDGELDLVTTRTGYYIVNVKTGAKIGNPTLTYTQDDENGYYVGLVGGSPSVQNIAIYDKGSYFYIWLQQNKANRLGGNHNLLAKLRLNKSTGATSQEENDLRYYLPSWYRSGFSIHPELGFFFTNAYSPGQYIYTTRFYNKSVDSIMKSWDFKQYPVDSNHRIASIRSALGFKITFGEYPIMIAGHWLTMPQKDVSGLAPNTKYYIYVGVINGIPDYLVTTSWLSTTIDRIYIGTIQTDNVGVKSSYVTKTYIEKSLVFDDYGHMHPISNNNIDFGSKGYRFRNVYAGGYVLPDSDGSGRWWRLRVVNGTLSVTQV